MWKFYFIICVTFEFVLSDSSVDYNDVNSDGTFAFRHSNDDIGNYYHSASKTPDQIVRGRYGSRNPANGRVEETVYTAGPRGFRARGPEIHRKMDLAQFPVGPKGSPDDPLADPYDDPSYSFNFKTQEYERNENADATGRVKGLYSYLDDVGDRHTVRYAAGAGTGYEVINAIPDSPASVAYGQPLYEAPAYTRGKMSVRRGPNGEYDFILSAPDHRRSETSGSDGIVRGSYSYLDDKGLQRTVQYIAGAGIGFRILQNTIGPGTHLNPRPTLPEYGINNYQSNDLDSDGYARPTGGGPSSPRPRPGSFDSSRPGGGIGGGAGYGRPGSFGGSAVSTIRPGSYGNDGGYKRPTTGYGGASNRPINSGRPTRPRRPGGNRRDQSNLYDRTESNFVSSTTDFDTSFTSPSPVTIDRVSQGGGGIGGSSRYPSRGTKGPGYAGSTPTSPGSYQHTSSTRKPISNRPTSFGSENSYNNEHIGSSSLPPFHSVDDDRYSYDKSTVKPPRGPDDAYIYGTTYRPKNPHRPISKKPSGGGGGIRGSTTFTSSGIGSTGSGSGYDDYDDYNRVPLVTSDDRQLNTDRNRDWSLRSRDSTVIKNVGKWYINLPPGQAVRAHVQNIDILPLGGRIPSPSEALRKDELVK